MPELIDGTGLDKSSDTVADTVTLSVNLANAGVNEAISDYIGNELGPVPELPHLSYTAVSGILAPYIPSGGIVDVASTAGDWTLDLSSMPADEPDTAWVKIDSSGSHTPTFPTGVTWAGGSAPSSGLWATGKRAVIKFTRIPYTGTFYGELVWSGDTPGTGTPTVTPVTGTFEYAYTKAGPYTTLGSATLDPGSVYIRMGPISDFFQYVDLWHNHTGALPAVGSEGEADSYMGRRYGFPYTLMSDGSAWDTNFDPTGNNRAGYDSSASNTIDMRYTYVDDTYDEFDATFTTTNPSSLDAYDVTYGQAKNTGATPSFNLTIPSSTGRAVLAILHYQSNKELTSATLGGQAMTVVQSRSQGTTSGVIVLRLDEANMPAAGTQALVPSFEPTAGASTVVHLHYWIFEGADTPDYSSVTPTFNTGVADVALVLAVADNSTVIMSVGHHDDPGTLTDDWDGTSEAELQSSGTYDLSSRSEWKADVGTPGTVSADWTPSGSKSFGVIVAVSSDGTAPPPTVVIPGVPVLATPSTAVDNQLTTTWDATADAVSYEGKWGLANPPATSTVTLGNVLTWTVAGLAASVPIYMQVRAVSSTGGRSAWSTVATATPTGDIIVVPPIPTTRFVHGQFADIRDITHHYGAAIQNAGGIQVPRSQRHQNFTNFDSMRNQTKPGSDYALNARSTWENPPTPRTAAQSAMGPRAYLTAQLSSQGHPKGTATGPQPQAAVNALLDMAKTGSTGYNNRDADLTLYATQLGQWTLTDGTPFQIFLDFSHESNGPTYPNYSGINSRLVGQAALTGASNAEWGAAMGAALRRAGTDGNGADVHRLAAEHAAQVYWAANPDLILVYTLTANAASQDDGGDLSTAWQDIAHPAPEYFDVFSNTGYCRSAGRPTYKGSGSVDDTANWTFQNYGLDSAAYQKAQEWSRPLGYWEFSAGGYDMFDQTPTYSSGASDNQSHIHLKKTIIEDFPQMDLAFLCWWTPKWDAPGTPNGSTFDIREASYGKDKVDGPVGTARFPKTLAIVKSIFPPA